MAAYPRIIIKECKWCGTKAEVTVPTPGKKDSYYYCSHQCWINCKIAWQRGASKFVGPLIGKVDVTPGQPKKRVRSYPKSTGTVPESFAEFKKRMQVNKEVNPVVEAEYWRILRKQRGIEDGDHLLLL